ncbi:MAG: hypothetical protein IKF96_03225 [Eggerthellaceae bacterium]|nr:hypothetical protein [Eggerthellaceae bacterium]
MESNEFGLWIIDEEELDPEERKNLPWYEEEDEDSMPRREEEPDPWAMYTYNEESDYL